MYNTVAEDAVSNGRIVMRLDSLIFEHRDALSLERRQDSTDTNGAVVVVDTRDVGLHPLTGADPKRVNRDGANCTPNRLLGQGSQCEDGLHPLTGADPRRVNCDEVERTPSNIPSLECQDDNSAH